MGRVDGSPARRMHELTWEVINNLDASLEVFVSHNTWANVSLPVNNLPTSVVRVILSEISQ